MIKARDLKRQFTSKRQTVEAVRGVNLDVDRGEIVAFLGPNGAGKTTTLRMLTTLLRPTGGEATVAGYDLLTDPVNVRRHIGYVAQGSGASDDQLVIDELVTQGQLYGLSAGESRARTQTLLERLDLTGVASRLTSTLSGGQRRRVDIALGLLHEPELLFLDEPSTGLDPQSRNNLWDHIRSLRTEHGTTVFLTTHYLDEADALCDRVLVIDNGRIVAEGTPDELKQRVSGDLIVLGTDNPTAVAKVVGRLDGADEPTIGEDFVRFVIPGGNRVMPVLLRELDHAGLIPHSVEVRRPTLDDVFLALTGRTLRESADGR
ncbi:ATP-binding cassette domain-containing protein [Micromonospora sp. NPDC002296]|uniref:ATP-binding cassette domain-containing protein n=1 Tax=Micromonospora sp. NPDC002296 TaxID=3154271 RepID=UPI00331796A8